MGNQPTTESQPSKNVIEKWGDWLEREAPYFVFGALAILSITYVIFKVATNGDGTPEQWGQFGDFIGGLMNPIISGLALLALVVSIRLQKTELAETRKSIDEQRREQRFFDLLNLYQSTTNTLIKDNQVGKAAIQNIIKEFTPRIDEFIRSGTTVIERYKRPNRGDSLESLTRQILSGTEKVDELPLIIKCWKKDGLPTFGHYFRTTFAVFFQLEKLLKNDHWIYGGIFRAQLSQDELVAITLHLVFDNTENSPTVNLACKYGLLKHLENENFRKWAESNLPPLAFGRTFAKKMENEPC
jgi:hypothetical protein